MYIINKLINILHSTFLSLKSVFFALTLIALTNTSNAKTLEKLKVAYVEFPPIEYKNNHDQPEGSFIDITSAVLNNAGLEFDFVYLPIARAYLYLKEGDIDMWPGLSAIPALQGYVLESNSIPITITLSAWYLEGTPPINQIKELSGTNTILINGYTYGGLLYKLIQDEFGMRALFTPTHQSGLQMLQLRRGDYFLDYNEPISAQLKKFPVDNLSHSVLNKRNGAFVVSKKRKNADQLVKKLDHSYRQLLMSGKIKPAASIKTQ